MIRRVEAEKVTDAYYEVERILDEDKSVMLTKEEIYMRLPRDSEGIPYVTISSLDNALRNLSHMRHIEIAYIRGVRYFGAVRR